MTNQNGLCWITFIERVYTLGAEATFRASSQQGIVASARRRGYPKTKSGISD